jgi:hypothetical protein
MNLSCLASATCHLAIFAVLGISLAEPARAQQASAPDEILVLEFGLMNAHDNSVKINGKPFDILGLQVGHAAFIVRNYVHSPESLLRKEGFTWTFANRQLRCERRVTIGLSSPFISSMSAKKQTNDVEETIQVEFRSPRQNNESYRIVRQIRYLNANVAPEVGAFLRAMTDKYGPSTYGPEDTRPSFPAGRNWKSGNVYLEVNFGYFRDRPGILSAITFVMNRLTGRFHNENQDDQHAICNATSRVDDERLRQMNSANTKSPRL